MGRLFGFLVDDVKRLLPAPALLQSPSWRKEAPFTPFANPSHRDPVKNILHLPLRGLQSLERSPFLSPLIAGGRLALVFDTPRCFLPDLGAPLRCMMYDPIHFPSGHMYLPVLCCSYFSLPSLLPRYL